MNSKYDEKFIYSLYDKVQKELKHKRFIHSVGVAGTAASMAMKYGSDVYKAQIAGILHDCAKCYDDDELVRLCRKSNIEVTSFEEEPSSPSSFIKAAYSSFVYNFVSVEETLNFAPDNGFPSSSTFRNAKSGVRLTFFTSSNASNSAGGL